MKSDKAKEFLLAPISRDIQESRQKMNEIVDEAVFHIREEAFDAAEQWLRTQLLRWRDPKEELPEEGVPVLVKFQCSRYAVLRRHKNLYFECLWKPDDYGFFYADTSQFIGWRPILE